MKKLLALVTLSLILVGCSSTPKEAPVATPEATPAETGAPEQTPGGETANFTELQKSVDSVLSGGSYEFPSFITVDTTVLKDLYNLSEEDVMDYAIFLPMMNTHATEIIVVEAKDGKLDVVKEAIDKRIADLETTWAQYLPAQYELVKNRVTFEDGNVVGVIIADNAQQIADEIQTAIKK